MTRILVIESETRARHALRSMLEGAGYEVDLCADGRDAERKHSSRPADLVIADGISEPIRLDGARLLAVPSSGDQAGSLEAQHFLPKPFRRDDLLAAVRATLGMNPPLPKAM